MLKINEIPIEISFYFSCSVNQQITYGPEGIIQSKWNTIDLSALQRKFFIEYIDDLQHN